MLPSHKLGFSPTTNMLREEKQIVRFEARAHQ